MLEAFLSKSVSIVGVFQYRERCGWRAAERKISDTVECAIFGASPRSTATFAKLRVDQCVICNPRPIGSQHASISTPTRCRGGKGRRSTLTGSVLDGLHANLFVPAAELPDRLAPQFHPVRQILHDGLRIRHRQQDASAARNPLLGTSVTYEFLQVSHIRERQFDAPRGTPSHAAAYSIPRLC